MAKISERLRKTLNVAGAENGLHDKIGERYQWIWIVLLRGQPKDKLRGLLKEIENQAKAADDARREELLWKVEAIEYLLNDD